MSGHAMTKPFRGNPALVRSVSAVVLDDDTEFSIVVHNEPDGTRLLSVQGHGFPLRVTPKRPSAPVVKTTFGVLELLVLSNEHVSTGVLQEMMNGSISAVVALLINGAFDSELVSQSRAGACVKLLNVHDMRMLMIRSIPPPATPKRTTRSRTATDGADFYSEDFFSNGFFPNDGDSFDDAGTTDGDAFVSHSLNPEVLSGMV